MPAKEPRDCRNAPNTHLDNRWVVFVVVGPQQDCVEKREVDEFRWLRLATPSKVQARFSQQSTNHKLSIRTGPNETDWIQSAARLNQNPHENLAGRLTLFQNG